MVSYQNSKGTKLLTMRNGMTNWLFSLQPMVWSRGYVQLRMNLTFSTTHAWSLHILHKFFYPRQFTQNEFLHKVNVVKKTPKYSLYVDFEILILTSPHLAGKKWFWYIFWKIRLTLRSACWLIFWHFSKLSNWEKRRHIKREREREREREMQKF